MKKGMWAVIATVAFTFLAGFVGGMELESISTAGGFIGAAVSLVVFYAALIGCGVIEIEVTPRKRR